MWQSQHAAMNASKTRAPRQQTHAQMPAVPLPVQVVRREEVARDVIALWLARPNTTQAPTPYLPGQFITLTLPTASEPLSRSYSLCGDGRADHPWQITVKHLHAGAVSTYLYDQAQPGMLLYASAPRGAFTLPETLPPGMPLAFVAAGSGIAPIYGMLRMLARLPERQRPRVQLHYAFGSVDDIIYGRELAALDPERRWLAIWHYATAEGQRLAPEQVLTRASALATAAHWYICGPEALKRTFQSVLLRQGVPQAHVHVEVFASPMMREAERSGSYPAMAAQPARLRIASSGATLDVRPRETLLEALERYGYHPPSGCRAGACGDCRLRVLSGQVRGDDDILSPAEHAAGGVLSCVSWPVGEVVIASTTGSLSHAGSSARHPAKTALRVGAAAAAMLLFAGVWQLTSHLPSATATGTSSDNGPSSTTPPTAAPAAQPPASNSGPNGPSGITTQPSLAPPNTHSGVS